MVNPISTNNKRIIKNTAYLYIQKIISLLIALYTSRILLEVLGVEDYGLYGIVGSIVLIFNSLRGLFSHSIQRFINIEKENDTANVNKIFCIGVMIQCVIAVVFFIIVETCGLLMLPKLNIHPDRIITAGIVFQFSILSAIVSIMTVPFDALIIANERFQILSIFNIIDYSLRLGIIFLLQFSPVDKVITYSFLLFIVSLFVRSINALYCRKEFREESRFRIVNEKNLLKKMASFSGWNFLGNIGYSITNEGLNIILNFFGGIIVNAARSIAYQVMAVVKQFGADVITSFEPRSMILYSQKNYTGFYSLMYFSTKLSFTVSASIALPLATYAPSILNVWLKNVPPYTVDFIRAIMFYIVIRSFHYPIDNLFKAAGELKKYQICELFVMLLNIPVAWLLLHYGFQPVSLFLSMSAIELINLLLILYLGYKQLQLPLKQYFICVFIRCILLALIGLILYFIFKSPQLLHIKELILNTSILLTLFLIMAYFIILDASERNTIIRLICKMFNRQ